MTQVQIYTDGACRGNPGPGGWGAVLVCGSHERELSGGEPSTTNNRMELTAAIRALEALNRPSVGPRAGGQEAGGRPTNHLPSMPISGKLCLTCLTAMTSPWSGSKVTPATPTMNDATHWPLPAPTNIRHDVPRKDLI